jgi:hypothetical protein
MASSSLITTTVKQAPLGALSACITQGTSGWLDIVKGDLPPSPKKPGTTLLKLLVAIALMILCSPEYSQSGVRPLISEPLLTTSSMTCTELVRSVKASYLAQGFSPSRPQIGVMTFIINFEKKGQHTELFAVTPGPAPELNNFCVIRTDTCIFQWHNILNVTFGIEKTKKEVCPTLKGE